MKIKINRYIFFAYFILLPKLFQTFENLKQFHNLLSILMVSTRLSLPLASVPNKVCPQSFLWVWLRALTLSCISQKGPIFLWVPNDSDKSGHFYEQHIELHKCMYPGWDSYLIYQWSYHQHLTFDILQGYWSSWFL